MSRLAKFILIVAICYAALKATGLIFGAPIPGSIVTMYMIFAVVTVLMVMTSAQGSAAELARPIREFLSDKKKLRTRITVLVILPALAGYVTLRIVSPEVGSVMQARTMHPPPPQTISAYGKNFDLTKLENPFRAIEKTDRTRFGSLVNEGGEIYFKRCVFCHGAKLDGTGQFAGAMEPMPAAFKGTDTIAQLQESYVFWRIVKGGRGLPIEGAQSSSTMPAWETELTEDEVWKTILFLYDFTGNRPRAWKK